MSHASSEHDLEKGPHLEKVGTVVLTPEMFEKLYLQPQTRVTGNLRTTFGNPTPVALIGLLLGLMPLACGMLEWMDASGSGVASTGALLGSGGLLMVLGGILEFFIGNTFTFCVFASVGSLFISIAFTNIPSFGIMAAFATEQYPGGVGNPQFYNTFAFYIMSVGFMCFIYTIAAFRTNIILVGMLLTTTMALEFLAGTYWSLGSGLPDRALTLQHAAGGSGLVTCILGWYLFLGLILASVDFPLTLPVGDLSQLIKGASERAARRD